MTRPLIAHTASPTKKMVTATSMPGCLEPGVGPKVPAPEKQLATGTTMGHAHPMPDNGLPTDPYADSSQHGLDMVAIAAEGRLIQVSPAWTRALGWSETELTTTLVLDFVHPEDLDATEIALAQLREEQTYTAFASRFMHKDGSYRNLRWSLEPNKNVVFVGARDISTYAGLRERAERSEAVATAILQTAVDPIVVIDPSGIIVNANTSTTAMFGYSFDELVGSNVNMLMPEPYRSEHDGYLARYLAEGGPRIIGIGREVEAQRADGSVFPMALAVSEVQTGKDHLFTGIIHDLTERNHQRDELFAANTELEARVSERTEQLKGLLGEVRRSNRDLEQFAYIASHDLQAPLRNVRQGLELLDEHLQETLGTAFDDEAQELRELVMAAILRMEELIRGLLAYSRIHQGEDQDRELIDLGEVVGGVVTMLTPEVHAAGGTISVDPLPELRGDPIQLGQVFQNLIENAVRYRSKDRDLAISIQCRDTNDYNVTIAVVDNGCGIEAAHHGRIFELFRRGHSGYDGVGLGLAICQRIIEGHGGRIWVESEAGQGASFLCELPA